jgi:geranyl-CoA carboxylase beta subunit
MHASRSGLAEFIAEDDAHAIEIARGLVAQLRWNDRVPRPHGRAFAPPRHAAEDLCGLVPTAYREAFDCREIIARVAGGSELTEFKSLYDPYTVCGFAEVGGWPVGIIGNNGPIDNAGAQKAAQFIQLCCQANKPIVYLQNTTGFIVGKESEAGGMIKNGARMIQAVANGTVPPDHDPGRCLLRRRQLRHVRAVLRAALPVRLAQCPARRHGRRAGGEGHGDRRGKQAADARQTGRS